ncbi:MAG: alanine racemase [Akkermansiaceae bacterium]
MPAPLTPPASSPPRTWAEIDLSALKHNLSVARETSGQSVMAVLKAAAYGHGSKEIAKALEQENIAFFGVASVIEARRLTSTGIKTPIYLLGPTLADERAEIVAQRWIPSVSNIQEAEHFDLLNSSTGNPPLSVHITVDTGMGRGGFLPTSLNSALVEILKLKHISIDGIGSHLPSADEDREFTLSQFDTFSSIVENCNHPFKYIHLANSAGILDYKSSLCNLCRPGLMLYGISPIEKFQNQLKPVLTLKSKITLIRELPAGHGVSYGRSVLLEKPTRVATVGAGYGDGYPRSLSGKNATVMIRGVRCPIIGRVTMDQIMVDVSALPEAKSGDEVELFGKQISVSEVAANAGTITWEVLTRITRRVTRCYLNK